MPQALTYTNSPPPKLSASRCGADLIIPQGPGLTGSARLRPLAGAVELTVWLTGSAPRTSRHRDARAALRAAAELLSR